jgi:hypothetical protein
MRSKQVFSMDNVLWRVSSPSDHTFENVNDLDPPVPERVALLKLCEVGEVVPDIGIRLDNDIFVVQEL